MTPRSRSDNSDEPVAAALARLYDLDLAEDPGDLDLYRALAGRTGGPILELAVGSGRIAVPLAAAEHAVTGVDHDPAMLERARAAAARARVARRVTLVDADLREVRLPDPGFRLAILGLNSLFLLGARVDQQAAIATLAAHLAPGGLAVIDVWLPDADDLARFDGRLVREWVRADPGTGELVTKTGSGLHDAATGIVRLSTVFEQGAQGGSTRRWVREDRLRLVSTDELVAMVEAAGLEVETLAGSHDLEPLAGDSDRAIVIARRP